MAEEAVRRKSQLFLNNLSPVKNTYENFVRKTLKPGKFLTTKTGAFKVAGMDITIILLTSITSLVCSILTYADCRRTAAPGIAGLIGGITLIIICRAIFMMYRYNQELDNGIKESSDIVDRKVIDTRKSIWA